MKKNIKDIQHQLNNELAKLFPTIEIMTDDPNGNHAPRIERLSKMMPKILGQIEQLSKELSNSGGAKLFHLSYLSQWVPSPSGIEADLDRILMKARPFNHDYAITGLLVYQSNHFIQYLEGELEDIYTVYGRISMDPRHQAVTLLSQGPISERNFLGWDMGSYIVSSEEEVMLEKLRGKFTQGRGMVDPQDVLSYMNIIKGYKLKKMASES